MIIIRAVKSEHIMVKLLPVIIMIFLFMLSSIPQDSMLTLKFKHLDKIQHFIAFSVLSFTWFLSLKTMNLPFRKSLILAVLFTFCYGIADELHQGFFTDGRTCDIYDLIADYLGATTSSFLLYIRYKKVFD